MGKPHFRVLLCMRIDCCVCVLLGVWLFEGRGKPPPREREGGEGRWLMWEDVLGVQKHAVTIQNSALLDFPQCPTRRPPYDAASLSIQVCSRSRFVSCTRTAVQPHAALRQVLIKTDELIFLSFYKSLELLFFTWASSFNHVTALTIEPLSFPNPDLRLLKLLLFWVCVNLLHRQFLSFGATFYKDVKKKDNSLLFWPPAVVLFIVNHVFDMQILRSRFWRQSTARSLFGWWSVPPQDFQGWDKEVVEVWYNDVGLFLCLRVQQIMQQRPLLLCRLEFPAWIPFVLI